MSDSDVLLKVVTDSYLSSHDYNGLPVRNLVECIEVSQVQDLVANLLEADLISVVFSDYHPNPHIKALPPEPVAEQLEKVRTAKFQHACLYPTPRHLCSVVDESKFIGRPFELCLARGEPQLAHKGFELAVLETYRNDPRYHYAYGDFGGHIGIRDEFFATNRIRESDRISLQSFGFCFDTSINIYVAGFVRYLANLSPEHQQMWASKQVPQETYLHPDYYRTSIIGNFPERLSLYEATLLEMKTSNETAAAMGRPPIFKSDFLSSRPREFGYLLRPTVKDFNDFMHLLDKMLSENLNKEFFGHEVQLEREETRSDGKIVVHPKGTLQMLDDWLNSEFKTDDRSSIDEMLQTLRYIRKLRQKPAHSVRENEFDQNLIHQQRDLMKSVYQALKTLRLILSCHPATWDVELNRQLEAGLIWSF